MGLPGLLHDLVACSRGYIHQHQRISDEVALDEFIKGRVCCERWGMVDFQQVNLAVVVDHEVETKDLETHVIGEVVWLRHPIFMLEMGLP